MSVEQTRRGDVVRATLASGHLSDERPRHAPCVRDELLPNGQMVLHETCSGRVTTLNVTAAFVWECCDGARSIPMIVAELRDVFPGAATLEADVLAVLQTFVDAGLIVDDCL